MDKIHQFLETHSKILLTDIIGKLLDNLIKKRGQGLHKDIERAAWVKNETYQQINILLIRLNICLVKQISHSHKHIDDGSAHIQRNTHFTVLVKRDDTFGQYVCCKTSRIVRAADGRAVSDFGARRAHNMDAAVYGARAAYIAGAVGTATVLAGQKFNIPVSGTMAHSWVMFYQDEYTAFKKYAEVYPDATVLLVDTYDVIHSGIPAAIRVAKEVLEPMGKRLKGIRIDSGDLAYLSKKVRKLLDAAGLEDCKIVVSNSLDEYTITSILRQGGQIDAFGVGERLITAKSDPVFGAVYKIAAVEYEGRYVPRIKVSEAVEKITNPGFKRVYRIYGEEGYAVADLIAGFDEVVDMSQPYRYVDPEKPWKNRFFENCTVKELQQLVVKDGKRVQPKRDLEEIRAYVKKQLDTEIWQEEQRFENPHKHYLDMSPDYYEMKMSLLHDLRG